MRAIGIIALIAIAALLGALFLWPNQPELVTEVPEAPTAAPVTVVAPPPPAPVPPPPTSTTALPSNTVELKPGPPAVIERIDDHSVRFDGKYLVQGSGSRGDPYRISWELLQSGRLTIAPEANQYELPGRLSALQDSWVEISGYWAPPLQRFETKDISISLNKWDGCCLGTPPTPFDSVEVQLSAPINIAGQHLFRYGTVRGRMHIEPFVAAGFLLGLYRLDEASLESS